MTRDEALKESQQIIEIKQQLERDLLHAGYKNIEQQSYVLKLQQRLDILRALFY